MLVFFYDKTFEGLLTAVFDAYSRKAFPEKLLEQGMIPPMFMQEGYTVISQADKATRVWTALEKKMTKGACNMLSYAWLSEEIGSDDLIFRFIRKTFDSPISIETNFADDDVKQIHLLAKKVAYEQQRLKQFVRFQKAADDIFIAFISPDHNSLPIAIDHFTDRFADQKWIIYDLKRKYGYYYDLLTTVEITLDDDSNFLDGKLNQDLMAEDEKLFQEMWKGYLKSLTIKERINLKLQRQHMPKRYWKHMTEKQ